MLVLRAWLLTWLNIFFSSLRLHIFSLLASKFEPKVHQHFIINSALHIHKATFFLHLLVNHSGAFSITWDYNFLLLFSGVLVWRAALSGFDLLHLDCCVLLHLDSFHSTSIGSLIIPENMANFISNYVSSVELCFQLNTIARYALKHIAWSRRREALLLNYVLLLILQPDRAFRPYRRCGGQRTEKSMRAFPIAIPTKPSWLINWFPQAIMTKYAMRGLKIDVC